MDRVDVRITDCHREEVLGTARMNDKIIWIPAKTLNSPYLREVVYHELCHALWGIEHNNDCPLMGPAVAKKALTKKECQVIFKKYAQR